MANRIRPFFFSFTAGLLLTKIHLLLIQQTGQKLFAFTRSMEHLHLHLTELFKLTERANTEL